MIIGPEEYARNVRTIETMNADYRQGYIPLEDLPEVDRRMFYFAYGSNMEPKQMKRRCPQSTPVCRGKLRGWEFMINERGVATLRKSNRFTFGVIYKVTALDLAYLDMYEGVKIGRYGRFCLPVEIYKGNSLHTCVVYIDPSEHFGKPKKDYLERVIEGAKHHNLPRRYVRNLRKWRSYANEQLEQSGVCLRDIEEGRWEPPSPTGD